MKSINKYFVITAILAFSSFCFPVQAEDITIGVVNTPRIVQQSPQGKKMREKLQEEFSGRKKDLLAEQDKLKKMQERMEKDSAIMSEAERQKLQRDMARLQRNLKRDQEAFQEDLQFQRRQQLADIQQVIVDAIQTVAKKNGYDLVMDQSVVYASNQVNITDQVIEYLKNKSG